MTLLEELSIKMPFIRSPGRLIELGYPCFKLPFDGELSKDELRMAAEENLGWAEWEKE